MKQEHCVSLSLQISAQDRKASTEHTPPVKAPRVRLLVQLRMSVAMTTVRGTTSTQDHTCSSGYVQHMCMEQGQG